MARGRQIFKQLYNIKKGEQSRVFYSPIYSPKHDFIAKIIAKNGPKTAFFAPFWPVLVHSTGVEPAWIAPQDP